MRCPEERHCPRSAVGRSWARSDGEAGDLVAVGLTFSYQWLRNGKAVRGATAKTYRLVKADKGKMIAVRVTATKSVGSRSGRGACGISARRPRTRSDRSNSPDPRPTRGLAVEGPGPGRPLVELRP